MKVINADLGAFLKRTNSRVICYYDSAKDKFLVTVDGYMSTSRYLDDAMDNAAEEQRRRVNNMELMRSEKSIAPHYQLKNNIATQTSTAPAVPPPSYPPCPKCGLQPSFVVSSYGVAACSCGHTWTYTP